MPDIVSPAEKLRRDPFRLFFPLGVLAGLIGVGQWIPWSMGKPLFMASFLHSTLQSQGFLAFFIVGFLLTVLPRFTGAPYASLPEVGVAFAGALVLCAGALARQWEAAQGGFLFMLAVLPIFGVRRLRARTKELPPSFLLMAFGLFHAAAGSIILAATRMGMSDLEMFQTGRWMVELGFPLCMVLGVTAKIAPFIMGHSDVSPRDEGPGANARGWGAKASVHGAMGSLLLATFLAEGTWPRAAAFLRAAAVSAHLLSFARIGRLPVKRTATALLFWTSCWMVPTGLWLAALFPGHGVAFTHVTFIGGFSLMIFSFGLLIVLTHAARAEALKGPMTPLKVAGALVAASLLFRLWAEFSPRQLPFLLAASLSWVAAAGLWLGYVLWKTRG